MDARKPDPATQSGDRIETRPPEDIFSSLPPEAPVPDGQPRKRSLFARILQVFRLIFVGDAEREQRPATGMAARLRENFSQASSAGDKPMTRKELFAALDAPLHGLMPDDINYASEVDAALSRRPAFTARALSVAVALLVVALLVPDYNSAILLAAIVGACAGFIPYNFNPAKIFMGDTGSTFLGFMLSSISIYGLFKMYAIISFAVPFLVLGLPIFDICFAVIRRVSKGQSPMHADRGHVHHRLIDMGFSQKQAVAIAYMLSAILGMAAVVLTNDGEMKALIFIGAVIVVGAIGVLVIFHRHPDKQDETTEKPEEKSHEEN